MRQIFSSLAGRTIGQVLWRVVLCAGLAHAGAVCAQPQPGHVPRLIIDAPPAIQETLASSLDLARAIALPDADQLGESEWSRLIAVVAEQARGLLRPLGYYDAHATVQREAGQADTIRISVDPGPATRVARLTFDVQGELNDLAQQNNAAAATLLDSVKHAWLLPAGAAFTAQAWSDAKSGVIATLRAHGYAAAAWSGTAAEVDAQSHEARLFVVADSGPLYRAGEIVIEGLQNNDARKVRDLASFEPGDGLTETVLMSYQERLQKTGLFEQVVVSLDPDTEQPGAARVLVQLHEAPRQTATVGLGYSNNTGPRVSLEYANRRLFDQPLTIRNKWIVGRDQQTWSGDLSTHPGEDFKRYLIGGTLERLVSSTDIVSALRLRLGRSSDVNQVERLVFFEYERDRECSRKADAPPCRYLLANTLNINLNWNRVDSILLPTDGYSAQLQAGTGVAGGSIARDAAFSRLYGRVTGYWPLGRSWYSQARIEVGHLLGAGKNISPDSQRFRAGGDDSVRGYAWRSLAALKADGSVTGGLALATASVEIAHPFSARLPSVWWAAFVDAGRAVNSFTDFKPALGYGLGVRWRSPVGALRVDLAWGEEIRRLRLHLSVGVSF